MYEVSNYSGKVKNTQTNEVFIQDDTISQWEEFTAWRENGGELIFVDFFINEISEAKTPIYIGKISNVVDHLITRALSSSIGKQGTRSYLESQRIIYQEKYDVAKGISVNQDMIQTITDEMNRDYPTTNDLDNILNAYGITPIGTKLERFYQFIIFRFENGLQFHGFFISLVEDFRTCSLTHVERGDFEKCDQVINLVENLPLQITQQQLIDLREEMLEI